VPVMVFIFDSELSDVLLHKIRKHCLVFATCDSIREL